MMNGNGQEATINFDYAAIDSETFTLQSKCQHCRRNFRPMRSDAVYCSRQCRQNARYRRLSVEKNLSVEKSEFKNSAHQPNAEFWSVQGELLGDILRWLITPDSLAGVGARCCLLAFYLNPEIGNKTRLADIASLEGAPTIAGLSKAMIEFQSRYGLKPTHYQKLLWMRDRYRRSARIVHQERAKSKSNGVTIN